MDRYLQSPGGPAKRGNTVGMKVMFLFQGIPHYYNYVLNQIEAVEGVELVNVVPSKTSKGIGAGVFQTREDIHYTLCHLDEYQPLWGGFFFRGLWKLLLEHKPDIVVTTEAHLPGFGFHFPTVWVMNLRRTPLILKSHPFRVPRFEQAGPGIFAKLKARIWRSLYQIPQAFVCYVESAYEIFGSYGVKPEKIFITYNSPDTDRLLSVHETLLKKGEAPVKAHRLIHVGRLVAWKRVDLLIRATAALKSKYPDIELLVVGEGPEADNLKRLARDLGIGSQVVFQGGVYDPYQLGALLMSSAVYVLAGMGGLSINEAMCFGRPVICSVCDGTEEHLVKEGINGMFFKEGDLADLQTKIDDLLSNDQVRTKMGERSLEIIREEINIHTVVQGYRKAFDHVLNNRAA